MPALLCAVWGRCTECEVLAESGCTRDVKGERKRDAGSWNGMGPASGAVSRGGLGRLAARKVLLPS